MTFDTKEEAYHAGMADGFGDGRLSMKKEIRKLEVKITELKQKILDLTGECECGCENPPGTVLSKED